MDLNIRVLGKSFLGSLLLSLYYTGNITKGNINKYSKKLGKEEHTLQEIIDYIEADKKTKIDLSSLVLVSHKDGKYAPMFTGCINYLGDNLVLPPNPDGYEGILEHLDEDGVEVHFFKKVKMKNNYIDKDINEQNFQDALINNDVDGMWQAVFFTCQNICKSIYAKRGFIAQEDDLYDTAMNATEMVMRNIMERGIRPEKLSSYCYTRCLCFINGYKQDKMTRKLKDFLSNNTFSNSIDYDNFIDNEDL